MFGLSFNNQPELTDVGTKPKEGLTMMAYEHNKPKTSVESNSRKKFHYNYHNCKSVQKRYKPDNKKGNAKVHNISSACTVSVKNEKGKMIWNTSTGRLVRLIQVWVPKGLISSEPKYIWIP